MILTPIDRTCLSRMQALLSASAGYEVSLQDELDYYERANSAAWLLATDEQGQQLGFIRSFQQGPEWSLGEMYIAPIVSERGTIARSLLEAFAKRLRLPASHRLRFDALATDDELNEALEATGFSQKRQRFLYFEASPKAVNIATAASPESSVAKITVELAAEIAQVLTHLHPVTELEATQWLHRGSIRWIHNGEKIAAAAQVLESSEALEINRLATRNEFLRQGFAGLLLEQILAEAAAKNKTRVYLRVEDVRLPAQGLYRKHGFQEQKDQAQIWHSRWY